MGRPATLYALVAAALFGASAPFAKMLLGSTPPLVLAGLLYLGAGLLALLLSLRARSSFDARAVRMLLIAITAGGIAGPVLLMFGLQRTAASTASLLLNLESVFTGAIAMALGERVSRRALAALALTVAGAATLSFEHGGATRAWWGPLAIAAACAAWGIDNNATQRLSDKDPLVVVRYKGLAAGSFSLALGLAIGGRLPDARHLGAALAVGALGNGLSLALYVRALGGLGAARTATLFATAPFTGALVAIALLHERPGWSFLAGACVLAIGAALLVTERR